MKGWFKSLLSLSVALLLLYIFFRGTDLKAFWGYLKKARLVYLLGFALGLVFFYWLRGLRWRLLYDGEGVPGIREFFMANVVGFSVNYLLPGRLGEVARAIYISRKSEFPSSYSVATVVVERFFDFFSIGVLLVFYLMSFPVRAARLKGNLSAIVWVSFLATLLLVLGILFLTFLWRRGKLHRLEVLLRVFPAHLREKLKNSGRSFVQGLHFFSSPRRALYFTLLGFLVWLAVALQYWLGLKAFGIHRPFFQIIPFIGVLLVGVSIPTPGMAGGFEVASKFFIVEIWRYSPNKAVAATITLHVILLLVTLSLGALVGLKEGLKLRRQSQ